MSRDDWWNDDWVHIGWTVENQYPNGDTNALANALSHAPDMNPGVAAGPTSVSDIGRVDSSTILSVGIGLTPGQVFYKGTAEEIAKNWDSILYNIWKSVGKDAMSYETWKENVNTPLINDATGQVSTIHEFAVNFDITNVGKIFFNSNEQALGFLQRSTTPISDTLNPIINSVFGSVPVAISSSDYDKLSQNIMVGVDSNGLRQQIASSNSVQQILQSYERDIMGIDPDSSAGQSWLQSKTQNLGNGSETIGNVLNDAATSDVTRQTIEEYIHDYQGVTIIPQSTEDWVTTIQNGMNNPNGPKLYDIRAWLGHPDPALPGNLPAAPPNPTATVYPFGDPSGNPDQFDGSQITQFLDNYIADYQGITSLPKSTKNWVSTIKDGVQNRHFTLTTARSWIILSDVTHQTIESYVRDFQNIQTISQPTEDWINTIQNNLVASGYNDTTLNTVRDWVAHAGATTQVLENYVKEYQNVSILSQVSMNWIQTVEDRMGQGVLHMSDVQKMLNVPVNS